jgi:hypothetical protein
MADEKKEPWLNYLALTTVIIAVCATLSTFRGMFVLNSHGDQSKQGLQSMGLLSVQEHQGLPL